MTLELFINTDRLNADKWLAFPEYGFRQYFLWKHPTTGELLAKPEVPVADSGRAGEAR
jgi:hypothetical protein